MVEMTGTDSGTADPGKPVGCPFCSPSVLAGQLIATMGRFMIVADLHPLVEGHLLLIPSEHFSCYGELPEDCWTELDQAKLAVLDFLTSAYAAPAFFEHGVAGQTVAHAHLHAVPGLPTLLPVIGPGRESRRVSSQDAVRAWFCERGPYLYYEERGDALLLTPGEIPPGYLERVASQVLPEDRPQPNGQDAAQRVRLRWHSRSSTATMP